MINLVNIIGVIVALTAVSTSLIALWTLIPRPNRILRAMR